MSPFAAPPTAGANSLRVNSEIVEWWEHPQRALKPCKTCGSGTMFRMRFRNLSRGTWSPAAPYCISHAIDKVFSRVGIPRR
jgi:hypothetical protein